MSGPQPAFVFDYVSPFGTDSQSGELFRDAHGAAYHVGRSEGVVKVTRNGVLIYTCPNSYGAPFAHIDDYDGHLWISSRDKTNARLTRWYRVPVFVPFAPRALG